MKLPNFFLTGSTGVIGGRLLKTLLKNTNANIYCLVRKRNDLGLLQKVIDALMVYLNKDEEYILESAKQRIYCFAGDVALPKLGLSDQEYDFLADKIDLVIHLAGKTNLYGVYTELERVNVTGTENIVQFALNTSKKYLLHVSTYSIAGEGNGLFTEKDFDQGQHLEFSSYQKSKFAGERVVRESKNQGLKWIIVRPGNVYGDSQTGAYPMGESRPLDFFYDTIKTFIETQTAFCTQKSYDITPVNYVCDAISYLCTKRLNEIYETYHLANPHKLTNREIIEAINECGFNIAVKSLDEYLYIIKNKLLRSENGDLYSSITTKMLLYNPDILRFSVRDRFDTSWTQSTLEKAGIYCDKIDKRLLAKYIERCIKNN